MHQSFPKRSEGKCDQKSKRARPVSSFHKKSEDVLVPSFS